ncbi:glycoside hydrolase family 32 protein [Treponema sp.]|uniref:glycoside hydrolase family 32 protein n=1 Tax=Treponema sp. TaxID=166 RepID=UPI00298D9849|nr:glycoside hydrolase family 32 protein [Treponema sp.]MCR5613041.1 glycoside hydrolase family 32 protein [Treponema sp.]
MSFKNRFRPEFHLSCPKGWMNDPNGFSFYNGFYHLFYQHNPKDTKWGLMHWGHAVSKDLLKWKNKKIALYPDSGADNEGCFSGTALVDGERHVLMYTGVSQNGVQQQCLAVGDGKNYKKAESNPVIKTDTVRKAVPDFNPNDFRDPKIWFEPEDDATDKTLGMSEKNAGVNSSLCGTYYCAAVIKKADGNGAVALFTSNNLSDWTFKSILAESKGELGGMWECPDFFTLEESNPRAEKKQHAEKKSRNVLIVSPQSVKADSAKGLKEGNNSVYMSGTFDKKSFTFIPDTRTENNFTAASLDYGIDFYAPQTMQTDDGRRVLIAWMQAWQSYNTPENFSWSGQMTLPRELYFKNDRLYQNPVKEYEDKIQKLPFLSGVINKNMTGWFDKYNYVQSELTLEITPSDNPEIRKNEKVTLQISDKKDKFVKFTFDCNTNELTFDRTNSIIRDEAVKSSTVKIEPDPQSKKILLRFIMDTFSCETFINNGQKVFTNTYFLNKNFRALKIDSSTNAGLYFKVIRIK